MSDPIYRVVLSQEAIEFFARADRPLAQKLRRCFAQLEREPRRHSNIKRLKGPWLGYFRYCIGDWRVIYRIEAADYTVLVAVIAHRREIYE